MVCIASSYVFLAALWLLGSSVLSTAFATSPATTTSTIPTTTTTIVVTGATGKVGSRLIQQLLQETPEDGGRTRVVALVRNATKAHSMFDTFANENQEPLSSSSLEIIEANFEDPSSLVSELEGLNDDFSLFLACGNVPNQEEIEQNIIDAAAAVSLKYCCQFCVKLSTAQPVVENAIGYGAIHQRMEDKLSTVFDERKNYAILRPHMFAQVLDPTVGGSLMGVTDLDNSAEDEEQRHRQRQRHMFADTPMAIIDCDDVAACAKAILQSSPNTKRHRGKIYELTGPEPTRLSESFAEAVSLLRPYPVSILSCSIEEQIGRAQLPPGIKDRVVPFFEALGSYDKVTKDVETLIGRPAKSIQQSVFSNPWPFLPKTFRRIVGNQKANSFREAAKIVTVDTEQDLIRQLGEDEVVIRVQTAGVNGGADTFSVTRAPEDAENFLLGNEGTGIVVSRGGEVTRFRVGDSAVFVGSGAYGEYVRVNERTCVAINAQTSTPTPASLSFPAEWTALRVSALTALVALTRTCPVQKGDVVLVTACCGGTGHFGVQIAKNAGAKAVIGTVGSTSKLQHAKDLGVIDRIVDLSQEDLATVLQTEYPEGVDIVYEGVGGSLLRAAYDNLAEDGRILIVGSISQYPHNEDKETHGIEELGDIMELFRSGKTLELEGAHDAGGVGKNASKKTIIGNVWGDLFRSGEMSLYRDRVYKLHSEGALKVILDKENIFYGLESVCDAVDHMLSRKSVGKVCVTISD